MSNMTTTTKNSSGMVSILVTMVMMIVISLIVLGLAEISLNEQSNSLNSQLSTQAYYAAESGINDARAAMNTLISSNQSVPPKNTCNSTGGNYGTLDYTVNPTNKVSYSCVLINPNPPQLNYDIGYNSTVVPINTGAKAVGSLQLSWHVPQGLTANASGCTANLGDFPPAAGPGKWGCNYPVVRVDVVDTSGTLLRTSWQTNTSTIFFQPFNSNTVNNNASIGDHGKVVAARCASVCTANITRMGRSNYYLRITTIYKDTSPLTIESPGNNFYDAQATIDSTGKAQNVLRRVLVAVDLTDANSTNIPSGAIVTQDSACKRFGITNTSLNILDTHITGGDGNPLCVSPTSVGTPTP